MGANSQSPGNVGPSIGRDNEINPGGNGMDKPAGWRFAVAQNKGSMGHENSSNKIVKTWDRSRRPAGIPCRINAFPHRVTVKPNT